MGTQRLSFIAAASIVAGMAVVSGQAGSPELDRVLQRMTTYVDSYGEKASLIIAVEEYVQLVPQVDSRPRKLISEFAIVKTPTGWTGYRDVVEVDGRAVSDRRDRLLSILTDMSADPRLVTTLADEGARFNVGPISRNFNVPTMALLCFGTANRHRFSFEKKRSTRVDGIDTWEIDFKEIHAPTLVMTRAGKDVPVEGTLWVVPADGVVMRTRLRMRNFADTTSSTTQDAPAPAPPTITDRPVGAREHRKGFDLAVAKIETSVDFSVTYRRHEEFGMWLPHRMSERYEGPLRFRTTGPPAHASSTGTATYSQFKQFRTDAKINIPKP